MSNQSSVPTLESLRLTRQIKRKIKLMELKYQSAIDDGRPLDAQRILKRAAMMTQRIVALKADLDNLLFNYERDNHERKLQK